MRLEPLSDEVVIRPLEGDKKTPGGIILPDSARRERTRGVVVDVGPGRYVDYTAALAPMVVKKGDVVLFSAYDTERVLIDNVEHYLVDQDSIKGIIHD